MLLTYLLVRGYLRSKNKRLMQEEETTRESMTQRLRTMRPFVLDNSIRETSVAQIRGHTIEDKQAILEAILNTGVEDILVGAFQDLSNVDEEWLTILKERGEIRPNFTLFSNLFDIDVDQKPIFSKIPAGIDAAIKYGVRNIVLEVDLAWNDFHIEFPLDFDGFIALFR